MSIAATSSYEQQIADNLSQFGLNTAGVSAFEGNFQVESGFNPNAYNAGENAHGFAQWEGGRWTALQALARKLGLAPTSAQAELAYLDQELSGPYSSVISQLRGVTDPSAAAQIVQSRYEGSTPDSLPQRQSNARAIYAQLAGGKPLTGGSGGGKPADQIALTAADTSVTGSGSSGPSLSDLLPWNWGQGLSDVASGVLSTLIPFLVKLAFIGGGIVLVLLGANAAARNASGGALP